jgi:hypothetical protein
VYNFNYTQTTREITSEGIHRQERLNITGLQDARTIEYLAEPASTFSPTEQNMAFSPQNFMLEMDATFLQQFRFYMGCPTAKPHNLSSR